ncbi:YdcF family protein [Kaistia dalseonensis]|uniref:Uncharacterized SAM-binding protein YcdF (DUF218 family) n=1 Tax=Kaistia dalseonensis TaxID=410840 RepID=A0ABU0H2M7_9HYPH|nr:YdcF family protein [Kaistia dalseonensis]MCX5493471.1 YdcF family protein [Kaistia dalseonensis]MDQ0436030.1 uncharacterized SAM-binding protein YcdF (DUF218 family) [Kaistia dalseonensis]
MFFYAAKLIWFVLQPSAALILLLVAGILAIGLQRVRLGASLMVVATVGLVIAGFLPLGPALLLPLEERFPRPVLDGPVTGIVVLGGGVDQYIGEARDLVALPDAGDRMTEAVALALRFPEARIVFTGGTAALVPDGNTEGQAAARFFRSMGIPDSRVTIEDKSRDTVENARFTKAMVQPRPGERWLLVTSAWHMPRAMGCFRAAGWPMLAWPTDYRTAGMRDLWQLIPRPAYGLTQVDVGAREWIGLLAYRLSGRTDALFPSP